MSLRVILMCWRVQHKWRPVRRKSCIRRSFCPSACSKHINHDIVLPWQHPVSGPLLQIWKKWKGRTMLAWLPRNRHTMHPDIFESIGNRRHLWVPVPKVPLIKKKRKIDNEQLRTARCFTSNSLLSTKRWVNSFSQLYIFTVLICAKSSPAQLILFMEK